VSEATAGHDPEDVAPEDVALEDVALEDVAESWPVSASVDLFRDDWVMALRSDTVSRPGHEERFPRLVFEHPGAVIVLAVDDDDRAFCLRQYRHPARRRLVELPAGLLDRDDEPPLEAARRELREEARLEAEEWTALASTWSSPGISNEVMHLFLARGLSAAADDDFQATHEEADMTAEWVPVADLLEAVLAGRLGDGPLVQTVLLAQAKGLLG
jgi:8-oxo-dGDP phosphatase